MRASRGTAVLLALAATVVASGQVAAHRQDEVLQAARLAIDVRRVDVALDLTPGIAVADAIIADIDGDRDGVLSPREKRAYVARVLDAVQLHVDDRSLHLDPVTSTFPAVDAFRRGEGTIQIESAVVLPRLSGGSHQLSFRNSYRPDVSVYLANALVPASDRIAVRAQRRDAAQRDLTIDYDMRAEPGTVTPIVGLLGGIAGALILVTLSLPVSKIHGARQ